MSENVITVPLDFLSYDGKTRINAKLWTSADFGTPDAPGSVKPKAVIQIVHGMSEYIDRYDDLAGYFVSRGFVVCAEDHIGHGKTAESPKDYGHIPLKGGKYILLNDVDTLRHIVAECYPGVPYVMYGHSMGSFIVRSYIARAGEGLAAAVLTGTGNVPEMLSKLGRSLAKIIAKIRGERFHSTQIHNLGAGGYNKHIVSPRTEMDWLSTDTETVDAYIADPKCGFMFTVGGYATLLELTAEVVTADCAAHTPKDLPCLFASGDADPVGDNGAGVREAAANLLEAGVETVDVILYPGMRHEIHNEIGREKVYDDLATWIEEHVAPKPEAESDEEIEAEPAVEAELEPDAEVEVEAEPEPEAEADEPQSEE